MTAGTGIHRVTNSLRHLKSANSPCLVGLWKCDEGTGNILRDSSGNGLDLSPLNAPRWKPNTLYSASRICTPYVPNGFYYQSGNGTSGASEPNFAANTTPGNTTSDGSITWTCRAVPNFWGGTAGYCSVTNNVMSPLYAQGIRPYRMWEYLRPTTDGNIRYTSTGTISFATSDNSISDSASAFPIYDVVTNPTGLAANDWILISGSTGNTANNTMAKISSVAVGKIQFAGNTGVFAVDAGSAGIVTIKKVLPPMSLVFRATIKQTMSFGGGNDLFLAHYFSPGGPANGLLLGNIAAGPRQLRHQHIDKTAASASFPSVGFLGSGSATDITIVVNRELATVEFYFAGFRDTGVGLGVLTKRAQCDLVSVTTNGDPALGLLYGNTAADGISELKNVHLYVGRNLPSGLTGVGTPSIISRLNSTPTVPLTSTEWPT